MNSRNEVWSPATLSAILGSWWATLTRDRWVQLVALVYLANFGFFKLSTLPRDSLFFVSYYTTIICLALAVLALRSGLARISEPNERRFWNDLSLAYGVWLAAEIIAIVFTDPEAPFTTTFIADIGYGLYYIACVFALERYAHREDSPDPRGLHRLLRWPAIVIFVVGLYVYFVLITAITNRELYLTTIPSIYIYLVVDVYIAARFLYLFWTVEKLRWKSLYGLLALTFIISIVNDFEGLELLEAASRWWGIPALWNFMIVSFVLAVRLRHHPFPIKEDSVAPTVELGRFSTEPRWQTLFFALVFPFIHFVAYAAGALDVAGRQAREAVVALWLLLIGTVALFQYRVLERSKEEIEEDRDSLSDELAWRKKAQKEKERLIAELETKNAELERFTYTVSHDLKSPLVTIKGFLGMLRKDVADGKAELIDSDLRQIDGAAGKMALLLDELLELSRIGRIVNEPQEVPLAELAREAAGLVAGPIAEKGVRLDISPDLPSVFGDRPRLLEVFQNLIENAVKFMGPQGEPRITVSARQDGEEPVFCVRDNGIGIDPQYHDKVFGLFERLDAGVGGTGIGLALVKRIVEVHGGRIWVESEGRGRGCAMCFTLPASDNGSSGQVALEWNRDAPSTTAPSVPPRNAG